MAIKKLTKADSKNLLYLGGGAVLIYYASDFIKSWLAKLKPTPEDARENEQKKVVNQTKTGIINVQKKGAGLNVKRYDTDIYLQGLASKFYEAVNQVTVDHIMLQNALVPIKSDADFAKMSQIYGVKGADGFGIINPMNLTEAIQRYANGYDKARINQSWANNKKYPSKITFKL